MEVCGVCRFLWLSRVALVVLRCMFRRLLVAQVSFLRMGLPLVSLWPGVGGEGLGVSFGLGFGGGGVGRRGLSVPRLPRASRKRAGSHASVLYRAFLPSCLNSSAELPGLFPLPGPIPKSKCAVVDTKEDRSACQVIPKVGVVTLLGCHKPGANLHQPGIEPGSHRWQRCILPPDH